MSDNYQSPLPCVACFESFLQRCFHHLYTRKARPDMKDEPRNKVSLCLKCHSKIHTIGTTRMAALFPNFKKWLKDNGWYFCKIFHKWKLDEGDK